MSGGDPMRGGGERMLCDGDLINLPIASGRPAISESILVSRSLMLSESEMTSWMVDGGGELLIES